MSLIRRLAHDVGACRLPACRAYSHAAAWRGVGVAIGLVALMLAPAADADQINFGVGDSIALDQPRVVAGFEDALGNHVPTIGNVPSGYTFIADTGASGFLIAAGGHMNYQTLQVDPDLYEIDAQYRELGVGGFQYVDVTAEYDVHISGYAGVFSSTDPPGDTGIHTVADGRALAAPNLNLGSFGGIIGMPGMVGEAMIIDLANMTPFDTIAVGYNSTVPAADPGATTYSFDFSKLHFAIESGRVNPGDPLPSYSDLPTIQVGTGKGMLGSTGDFLFDTGAQLSMISSDTAANLNIDLDDSDGQSDIQGYLQVGGVGGQTLVPLVQVDELVLPSNEGTDLVFEDISVGVIDIEGLPVDGILGFNAFTTGYLAPVLASLEDPTSAAAQLDGALIEMILDFTTTNDWSMRLTVNPDYAALTEGIDELADLGFSDELEALLGVPVTDPVTGEVLFTAPTQALFAWPAFAIPEPGTAALLLVGAPIALLRRRQVARTPRRRDGSTPGQR